MHKENKGTPSWILFFFYASMVVGVLVTIFEQGFLKNKNEFPYRLANSTQMSATDGKASLYATAKISIVPKRSPEAIKNGEQNFSKVCVACHGTYGQYKVGLTGVDLSDGTWLHYSNEEKIGKLIMNGVSASESVTKQVMAPRGGSGYSDKQIWEIVYYLSSKNKSIIKDAKATE